MEVGAIGGTGAEDSDEIYESKSTWKGHSIRESRSDYSFEEKIFSNPKDESTFSKKCAAFRPLMGKAPDYTIEGRGGIRIDQNGDPYGSFDVTIRISSRDQDNKESKDKDRYYDHNEKRPNSGRNNESSNSSDRD